MYKREERIQMTGHREKSNYDNLVNTAVSYRISIAQKSVPEIACILPLRLITR